jgi:hypothetical protein
VYGKAADLTKQLLEALLSSKITLEMLSRYISMLNNAYAHNLSISNNTKSLVLTGSKRKKNLVLTFFFKKV